MTRSRESLVGWGEAHKAMATWPFAIAARGAPGSVEMPVNLAPKSGSMCYFQGETWLSHRGGLYTPTREAKL